MNPIRKQLLLLSSSILLSLSALTPAAARPTYAQPAAATAAAPRVDGFDVEPVRQLAPGSDLAFTLRGTPGASATIAIDGARRSFTLDETQLGVYEGTYTVSTRDRITPESRVTANLRLGNRVATAVLDDPLVEGMRRPAPAAAAAAGSDLRIDRFDATPARSLATGNELSFSARGTPGAQASVQIPGARRFFLQEARPGVYAGSYTVHGTDRIEPNAQPTLRLTLGDAATTTTLSQPLVAGAAGASTYQRPVPVAAACANCATVVEVNPIEVKGAGSYVGPVAGGVVGALLGSQIGGGNGRTLGGVAGAVGGALAGREIERRVNKATHYEVVARLAGGGRQTFTYESDPGLPVGTRVRVVDGRLVRER